MIKKLSIEQWNQFEKIELNFHPKITIITGANGSGKSTLIKLLSREMGWEYGATATPPQLEEATSKFFSGITKDKFLSYLREKKPIVYDESYTYKTSDNSILIGKIELNDKIMNLYVPEATDVASYHIISEIEGEECSSYVANNSINGVSIPSHRQPYTYTDVQSIPVKPRTQGEAHFEFLNALKELILPQMYFGEKRKSPIHQMKASIIALAIFGLGNSHVSKDDASYKLFRGFVEVLRNLLPANIGFEDINVKDGEVILVTKTGQFLLDAASGGIGSIIDLAWQIYMYDNNKMPFVVLVDEIENHLHPSMQREILPNLVKAFPEVQFIVTTHSPFVVNSVADSKVYALKYNQMNFVESFLLDFEAKTSNAIEILKEVLGVPVTLPVWVENDLKIIIEKYKDVELTPESYLQLKKELSEYGLDEYLPHTLKAVRGE